jgi:hypothetical protein
VLVALIIFSLTFGAIAQLAQTTLRQSATAEAVTNTVALAQSQLARFGSDLPLRPGEFEGTTGDGLAWRARVALATPPGLEEDAPAEGYALYRIDLEAGPLAGGPGGVVLTTLRVGPAP